MHILRRLPQSITLLYTFCISTYLANAAHHADAKPLLGMNDVSVLWPLPTTLDDIAAPPAMTVGEGGMLSALHFKHLPALLSLKTIRDLHFPPNPTNAELLPELKVVALRFDPCFRDLPDTGPCAPQLRLVVQAVVGRTTRDIAIHLFYRLDPAELSDALSRIAAARGTDLGVHDAPLSVNPTLISQGPSGPYATVLKRLLSAFARQERLVRMAFMSVGIVGNQWTFGSFDVNDTHLTPVAIPNLPGAATVRMTLSARFRGEAFFGVMTPRPTTGDHARGIFRLGTEQPERAADLVRTLLRIEHPAKHGPGSTDCVSCHVAMVARETAKANYPGAEAFPSDRYTSTWPLTVTGTTGLNERALRAFGYVGEAVAISQRTVNETAAVLDRLMME